MSDGGKAAISEGGKAAMKGRLNPCEPFIRRPVATTLLALGMLIIGAAGLSLALRPSRGT